MIASRAVAAFALDTRQMRGGRFALKAERRAEADGVADQALGIVFLVDGFQRVEGFGMGRFGPFTCASSWQSAQTAAPT